MSLVLEATLNVIKAELKKLQSREAVLSDELKTVQQAVKFLQKALKGVHGDE